MIRIRPETPADFAAVREVYELVFGRPGEVALVEALRTMVRPLVSLVADADGRVIGHVLFSPVTVEGPQGVWTAMGLAPIAVRPERQGAGLGPALVQVGLKACAALGEHVVVVLSRPRHFLGSRFVPAATKGLRSEYPVPDEAFLVAELAPGALQGRTGLVKYHPEFAHVRRHGRLGS